MYTELIPTLPLDHSYCIKMKHPCNCTLPICWRKKALKVLQRTWGAQQKLYLFAFWNCTRIVYLQLCLWKSQANAKSKGQNKRIWYHTAAFHPFLISWGSPYKLLYTARNCLWILPLYYRTMCICSLTSHLTIKGPRQENQRAVIVKKIRAGWGNTENKK